MADNARNITKVPQLEKIYDGERDRGNCKKSRKEQDLTQPQLAMACGTGVRFIVDLEAGKETCQIGKVRNVIQMLGLKVRVDKR